MIRMIAQNVPGLKLFGVIYHYSTSLAAGGKPLAIGGEFQKPDLASFFSKLTYRLERKLTTITDVICKK